MRYTGIRLLLALALAASVGKRVGEYQAEKTFRRDYPYLHTVNDRDPQPGDIWLTHNPGRDTFAVSVYRDGWQRVYVYPEK